MVSFNQITKITDYDEKLKEFKNTFKPNIDKFIKENEETIKSLLKKYEVDLVAENRGFTKKEKIIKFSA
mgnify:CR=1 FL=1